MTTYCCDCKWMGDETLMAVPIAAGKIICTNKTYRYRCHVTGEMISSKCKDINHGDCLGFESNKSKEEIIAETDSNNPVDS